MSEIKDHSCLGEIFFHSLKRNGTKVLLYVDATNEAITQSEILAQSIRTALKLKKKGIARNDIIGACTNNHKYSCLPLIAAQYLGAICTYLDPSLSQLVTVHLLKQLNPRILFVSEEILEFIETCINEACVDTELVVFGSTNKYSQFSEYLQFDEDEQHFYPANIDEAETALIVFSSGTTGFPKGICLSHKCIIEKATNCPPYAITKKNPPVSVTFASLYWISSQRHLIYCIITGSATVLCNKCDAAYTWKLIEKYKITDLSSEESLSPNKEGELRVKSEFLMTGYYKMDSSSVFDSEGFFKTGDLAYYDEDDCIYIVDRIAEIFDYKGWFIYPAKLEVVVLSHPAVKEAAVIGMPCGEDGFQPMGVIVLNDDYGNIKTDDILNYINEQLCDSEKLGGGLKILKSLPKTASGKVKRRDLINFMLGEIKAVTEI